MNVRLSVEPKKIKMGNTYIIMAHRWGNTEEHSYFVGWEDGWNRALEMADEEFENRGRGKYSVVVYEVVKGCKEKTEVHRVGV